MEIKNEALKSLYEYLISGVWSFCPCTKDDVDTAFKKCDDELEKEKEKLMKDLEDNVLVHYKIKQLEGENEELRKKCTYFEKLSTERLKATEELHQQLDTAEKEREAIREESLRNIREGYKTECDLRELRQKYDYLERSHKRLGDIRNRLAKENEDLKQQNYTLGQKCQAGTNTREYWRLLSNGRGEKICKLMQENAALQRQIKLQDSVRKNCYDQGQTDLWVKLQDVKDMQPNEFDVECECLGDVIDMDLEDFLDAYKKWWEEKEEQKRLDEMRDYLHRFCVGKVCYGCPLNTPEFKCYGPGRFDSISDEDLKKCYEKARSCAGFRGLKKKEEKSFEEVPCSFNWKLDGTEYTIETSIPRADYDTIVKIISGKE